jgi:DNA-binding transcriptional regulator YiaG
MTAPLRHVEIGARTPLAQLPAEAIEALLDRGSIGDWRALSAEIMRSPWGELARAVDAIIGWDAHGAVDTLMRTVIDRARQRISADGRDRYATAIRDMRRRTGLSLRALAALAGTSAARLSDYEHGRTSPTTEVLARLEHAATVATGRATRVT